MWEGASQTKLHRYKKKKAPKEERLINKESRDRAEEPTAPPEEHDAPGEDQQQDNSGFHTEGNDRDDSTQVPPPNPESSLIDLDATASYGSILQAAEMHEIPKPEGTARIPDNNAGGEAQVHPALLKVKPDDLKEVFFRELAEICGAKWEEIGNRLHMKQSYLDQLRMDFQPGVEGNTTKCAFGMLNKWVKREGGTEGALQNLYQALLTAGEGQAARFLVQMFSNISSDGKKKVWWVGSVSEWSN